MSGVRRRVEPHEEPVELLLDDLREEHRQTATRLVRFFRILASDVTGLDEQAALLDDSKVRDEYIRDGRRRLVAGLLELLRHHLGWYLGGRSFLSFQEPKGDANQSWQLIVEELSISLPAPGESCLSVVDRLVSALEEHSGVDLLAELWRGRWLHARRGPAAGEDAYRRLLERISDADRSSPAVSHVRRRAVAGVAAALLERGLARLASAWLNEHAELVRRDARLRRLTVWARIACGELAGARRAHARSRSWDGPLPDAMCELRVRRPELSKLLLGAENKVIGRGAWPPRREGELLHRAEFGACAMALFKLDAGRGARAVRVEVAPAMCGFLDPWLAERALTPFEQGSAEQVLVSTAGAVTSHRDEGRHLCGVIGSESSMASLLQPLLDPDGDLLGWVYLEFEHHLIPDASRRAELAEAALRELEGERSRSGPSLSPSAHGPITRAFEELVERTELKLARRRWWGLERDGEEFTLVASGGEGLPAPLDSHRGQAGLLRRALCAGGPVSFDEPDVRLSLHPAACSGVAIPLGSRGRVFGALLVESSRRSDFSSRVGERLIRCVEEREGTIHLARMQRWYESRFGAAPHLPVESSDFHAFARRVGRVGASKQVAFVCGPAGVGKSVVARWLHYEGDAREGRVHLMPGSSVDAESLCAHLEGEAEQTLLLEGVDELEPEAQVVLAAHLDQRLAGGESAPRLIVTSEHDPREAANAGLLRRGLAAQLDRLSLFVPPLSDRREELEGLLKHLLARAAEHGAAPVLDEGALMLLWRQPWAGGVRELEGFVCKLMNEAEGREIFDADFVEGVASESRFELISRIPSRHPRRADLLAALVTAATRGGRSNKTRAARFLGWDPDTLVARMADLQLPEEDFMSLHHPWTS